MSEIEKRRDKIAFTTDQVDLIKSTVAKGATDDELKLFLYQAQKMGLDPLARQIYFQKRRNRKSGEETISILTGIDGYRLTADRTGLYAGQDDAVYDDEARPSRATVTVYKLAGGIRCAFAATARWDQYYPGDGQGFMWNKMPHLMLAKCAEALALRKAFPAELSGVYTKEELDQAAKESDIVEEGSQGEGQRPANPPKTVEKPAPKVLVYDMNNARHRDMLAEAVKTKFPGVPKDLYDQIGKRLHGRPHLELRNAVDEVEAELTNQEVPFELGARDMTQGAKTFLLKDFYDLRIHLDRAISNLECDKDDSWPHRLEEMKVLLEDSEQWIVILYGGRGNYDAAKRQVGRVVEN